MDGTTEKARRWGVALVACIGLWGPAARAAETTTYVLTDVQGTVLAREDAHGNIIARYDYRPYGKHEPGPKTAGPGYTSHVEDPDTGLVYMQQRYYDPEVGRFLSVDPILPKSGVLTTYNRYAYAANRPTLVVDPDGRENMCVYTGKCLEQSRAAAAKHPFSIDGEGSATGVAALGVGLIASKGLTKNASDSVGMVMIGEGLEASIDGAVKIFSFDLPKGSEKIPANIQFSVSTHLIVGGKVVITINNNGRVTVKIERGFGLGHSVTYLSVNAPVNEDNSNASESEESRKQARKMEREQERRMRDQYLGWGRFVGRRLR